MNLETVRIAGFKSGLGDVTKSQAISQSVLSAGQGRIIPLLVRCDNTHTIKRLQRALASRYGR